MRALKFFIITLCTVALTSCSDSPTEPQLLRTAPESAIVPSSNIPSGSSATLYRGTGSALGESPIPVSALRAILNSGFGLRRAWRPRISICAAIELDELILQLGAPDSRMADLGFLLDTSSSHVGCTTGWDEYNFSE